MDTTTQVSVESSTPGQPAGPVGSPTPPRQKMSKRTIWAMMVGVVVLLGIVITAIVLAVINLSGPTKAQYQPVIEAAMSTRRAHGDYRRQNVLSRAKLDFSTALKNLEISTENLLNINLETLEITGEIKPQLSVDEATLDKIEAKERESAKQIVAHERTLDDMITKLGDSEVTEAYNAYASVRQKVYGEGLTAEQFIEGNIRMSRVSYACFQASESTFSMASPEDAKKFVVYLEGCITQLKDAQEGNVLRADMKRVVELMQGYFQEAADAVRTMVARGAIDESALEAINKKHEAAISEATEAIDETGLDAVEEALDKVFDVAVERANDAPAE